MASVIENFRSLLPPRAKSSPSGWTSFNAPCCHHRGHSADKRKRAGVRFDNGLIYNCFNCKFTTGWQPGSPLGEKMKTLCRWLGASDDIIKDMTFDALKSQSDDYTQQYKPTVEFTLKSLPEGSMSISDWINSEYFPDVKDDLEKVIAYLLERGVDPLDDDFFWSIGEGYHDRVILPFRYHGKIVGNTARKIRPGNPKYLSDQHPHFVYNFDRQQENQRYSFVAEGPFDALGVEGMALLTNEISDQQARIINSLNSEVIVIPDQDRAGLLLFDRAAELDWSVAMPNWEPDVKDCAEAVRRYGKLFVVVDAINNAQKGQIKITMAKKKQEKKLDLLENEKTN